MNITNATGCKCVNNVRNNIYTLRLRFVAMQHRGELLESAVRQSGIPLARITKKLNRSRRWLYNQFAKPDVSVDVLMEVGKLIHHDFLPELHDLSLGKAARNISMDNTVTDYGEQNAQYWKDKYMHLLEEYNTLLKKHQ